MTCTAKLRTAKLRLIGQAPLIALIAVAGYGAGYGTGCGSTGQESVSYPIVGRGQAAEPFLVDGWEVTLTSARVGVGPIYFCATEGASSELCPIALGEFADAAVIDALDPTPRTLGRIDGFVGEIRSATYDFAYSWFNTQ